MRKVLLCLSSTCLLSLYADNSSVALGVKPDVNFLTRADSMPESNYDEMTDLYLEGYIQALLDMHYYEHRVLVSVKDHNVTLSNMPNNALLYNSILNFVNDIAGVKSVQVKEDLSKKEIAAKEKQIEPRVRGVWFPQSTVLFQPLVADPREPMYFVAYRRGDRIIGKNVASVCVGDDFPIFRWRNVFKWQGDLQIGIQAGVWAVFNFEDVPEHVSHEFSELVNTDYLVGIPLTYAVDKWSFRLRIYHQSSHLGDEFLVNHPDFLDKRKNPSYEAIDFFTAYQFTRGIRGYFGPGVIVHSDKTFPMKTFYIEYGAEFRMFGKKLSYHRLFGTPFFAVHLENWQARNWDIDATFKLGYEWSKMQGVGRKMRLYVDYHTGYSYEGQFFKKRVNYGEIGLSWGW